MTSPLRVVVAAGGTGGHIAPALVLADALEQIVPDARVACVCGTKPFEAAMYRRAGREPLILQGRALFGRNPVALARAAGLAARATVEAWRLLRRERPDVVVGLGGYVAGPVLAAATLLGIPIHLHEQNAVPGRTNRWLARLAHQVTAAHAAALGGLRCRQREVLANPSKVDRIHDIVSREDVEQPGYYMVWSSSSERRRLEITLEDQAKLTHATVATLEAIQRSLASLHNKVDDINMRRA